jgi:hypothetical protein
LLLNISRKYTELHNFKTAIKYDFMALDLINKFPPEEIHAVELSEIYSQIIQDLKHNNSIEKSIMFINNLNSLIKNNFLSKNNFFVLKANSIK